MKKLTGPKEAIKKPHEKEDSEAGPSDIQPGEDEVNVGNELLDEENTTVRELESAKNPPSPSTSNKKWKTEALTRCRICYLKTRTINTLQKRNKRLLNRINSLKQDKVLCVIIYISANIYLHLLFL